MISSLGNFAVALFARRERRQKSAQHALDARRVSSGWRRPSILVAPDRFWAALQQHDALIFLPLRINGPLDVLGNADRLLDGFDSTRDGVKLVLREARQVLPRRLDVARHRSA